jgi:predicted RNA-binding Zn-ribbon protein involved in translation (DUF1610 family)
MGDTLSNGHASANAVNDRSHADDEMATFQCPLCGAQQPATDIRYDQLGYPICPACSYAAGP